MKNARVKLVMAAAGVSPLAPIERQVAYNMQLMHGVDIEEIDEGFDVIEYQWGMISHSCKSPRIIMN